MSYADRMADLEYGGSARSLAAEADAEIAERDAEIERLRKALHAIAGHGIDWSKGVAENVAPLEDIARDALAIQQRAAGVGEGS